MIEPVAAGPARFDAFRGDDRNLDVMRAVAVCGVIVDHIMSLFTTKIGPVHYWHPGTWGVFLFFVHTSLVLMRSLEKVTQGRGWVWVFYVRRAFRIYPLAWAAIALVLITGVPARAGIERGDVIANVFLVQNLYHNHNVIDVLWSLPIELQMYLLLPAAYLVARRGLTMTIAAFVIGYACSLAYWFLFRSHADPLVLARLSLIGYIPCFASGILAYAMFVRMPKIRALPAWLFPVALACSAILFVALTQPAFTPWAGWPACLLMGLTLPCVRELEKSVVTDVAHVVAKYSYGIYLLHKIAIGVASETMSGGAPLPRLAAFTLLLFALPPLGYHFIEKPGIELGGRLTKWREQRVAVAPAP